MFVCACAAAVPSSVCFVDIRLACVCMQGAVCSRVLDTVVDTAGLLEEVAVSRDEYYILLGVHEGVVFGDLSVLGQLS